MELIDKNKLLEKIEHFFKMNPKLVDSWAQEMICFIIQEEDVVKE